ncbi:MAG: asparagine synthase B [Chloroflexota bacterium]
MCGIAGVWSQPESGAVHQMMHQMAHRGPDGSGVHIHHDHGVLGHVRLSIMDPEDGTQPLYNENQSAIIVANGEVYNHHILRDHLVKNHHFMSTSDSETVLHLFEEQRNATVNHLEGMFAFAIVENDNLFLARDPIGIKPLYYGLSNAGKPDEVFYFASELKAIVDHAETVHEFPPGTYYHSQYGFRPYYTVPKRIPRQVSVDEHIRHVRQTLEESIVKHLMSDVPLGAFLSGGLDSSIIAAIARQHMPELHTFSVGIEGSRDLEAARRVAKHIDSIHHEYAYTVAEVRAKLPEIIYHLESFDQDLVRSAIPTFFCARMAADYVKVILTGEGADELFAGYTYYKDIHDHNELHQELRRSIESLHNVNLQRVDRMTMCHSIEGRVPFLDTSVIDMAQTIPAELKLYRTNTGQNIEKWILRKAVEDLLPHDIVWRNKEQFDEGSGTVDMLQVLLAEATAGIDHEMYVQQHPTDNLRSPEESFYHQLLVDAFENHHAILRNVGRWQI